MELAKGLLALLAASGLEIAGPAHLRLGAEALIHLCQLDPSKGDLAWPVRGIDPGSLHIGAAAVLAYGTIHLGAAWGLWWDKTWDVMPWCVTAALYQLLDDYALVQHCGLLSLIVFAISLLVAGVLARNVAKRGSRRPKPRAQGPTGQLVSPPHS